MSVPLVLRPAAGVGTALLLLIASTIAMLLWWWLRRTAQTRAALDAALRAERSRLAAVLAQLPAAVVVADAPTGRLLYGNQRLEEIWGRPFTASPSTSDLGGWLGLASGWPPAAVYGSPLERALAVGETVAGEELPLARADGTAGVQRVHAAPVRDGTGRVIAGVAVIEDITAAHAAASAAARAARRLAALQRATEHLGSALTIAAIADVVIERVMPVLDASAVALAVLDERDGTVRVARAVGYPDEIAAAWLDCPLSVVRLPTHDAVADTPGLVYLRSEHDWNAWCPGLARAHATSAFEGAVVLPCAANGRLRGAILLSFRDAGTLAPDDETMAETLAAQCGQALYRVQLFEGQRRAQADAEVSARRIAQLQEFTERVSMALTSTDVVRVMGQDAAAIVAADAATLYLAIADTTRLDPAYRWASDGASPVADDLTDLAVGAIQTDELLVRHTATTTALAVPLRTAGAALGALTLTIRRPWVLGDDDRELLLATGRIAAQGITRARLQWLQEEERRRLARELHDEFGQALTGLKLDLAWLGRQLQTAAPHLATDTAAIATRVDATVEAVRRIAAELRPAVLDDLGLIAALEWQVAEFGRRSGVSCKIELPAEDEESVVNEPVATVVFRVTQEALTNVARHARAQHVVVRLAREDDRLVLRVADDGVGITPGATPRHGAMGLIGMRERAAALRGEVTVGPATYGGTVVTLTLPAVSVIDVETSRTLPIVRTSA